MANDHDCLISVDVECSGPIPGDYSMLSLGACIVGQRETTFYAEFQPLHDRAIPDALRVTGFDLAQLRTTGQPPQQVMASFRDWVRDISSPASPVFVGFNAGFDWSFVNWYFHHFVGDNPFGYAPLDIKSYYMGRSGCQWNDTKSSRLPAEFHSSTRAAHHALADAQSQAEIFEKMRR
jgi:DNA polymerase III epsilon subunit-like protein